MSDRTFARRLASAEENIANHGKAIHGDVATQIGYLVRRLAWLEEQLGVERSGRTRRSAAHGGTAQVINEVRQGAFA